MHELSDKQMTAITALLSGKQVTESAKHAGIDVSTIRRWLRNDAHFQEALAEGRREALQIAMNRAMDAAYLAADTVVALMRDKRVSPAVRLRAATSVLEMLLKWAELQDFDHRLKRLEGKNDGDDVS